MCGVGRGLDQGLEGCGDVSFKARLYVYVAGPAICILCSADTCAT